MRDDKKPDDKTPPLDAELQAEADAVLDSIAGEHIPAGDAEAERDQEKPADIPMDEVLRSFFDITFNGYLKARGAHWAMNDGELATLSKSYAAVIYKYWPDLDFGVEFTAVVLTVSLIGPRVATDAAIRAAKEEKAQGGEPESKPETPSATAEKKQPYSTGA